MLAAISSKFGIELSTTTYKVVAPLPSVSSIKAKSFPPIRVVRAHPATCIIWSKYSSNFSLRAWIRTRLPYENVAVALRSIGVSRSN